jgi:hypothetical protein
MSQVPETRDETIRLGLLMETAQAHQQLIDGSLTRLQLHTEGLDEVVRDAIRRTLVQEFMELREFSDGACSALRELRHAAQIGRAGAHTLLLLLTAGLIAAVLWWWLPSRDQIAALREERQQLQSAITLLAHNRERMDLRQCGAPSRLCVRVDRHAPVFGEHADYFVIAVN